MPTKIELQSAPSTLALYWRILTARKSGAVDEADTLLAEATLAGIRSDPVKLAGYRKVCGFTNGSHLPATFPFVQAMPLQLSLLVSDAFPFSPLGIVHVSNRITQYRPVAVDELLDFRCTLSGPRRTDRGLEFDLLTQVTVDGELVWECLCTMLRRDRATRKRRRPGSSGGVDLGVHLVDHGLAPGHEEAPVGVGEVVLDVDDDQRHRRVVAVGHHDRRYRRAHTGTDEAVAARWYRRVAAAPLASSRCRPPSASGVDCSPPTPTS